VFIVLDGIHEGYAVFLLKSVSRLGLCLPKILLGRSEWNGETVLRLSWVAKQGG